MKDKLRQSNILQGQEKLPISTSAETYQLKQDDPKNDGLKVLSAEESK
jgi:hypothetical protein